MIFGVAFFGCSDNQPIYGGPDESEAIPEVDWSPEDDRDLIINCLDVIQSCHKEIARLTSQIRDIEVGQCKTKPSQGNKRGKGKKKGHYEHR